MGGSGSGGRRPNAGRKHRPFSVLHELTCRLCRKSFVARIKRTYCSQACRLEQQARNRGRAARQPRLSLRADPPPKPAEYFRRKSRAVKARRCGVTIADIERLTAAQGGRCAICWELPARVLAIDHDHETGAFRGLICQACNSGIGFFRDNPGLMSAAVRYLMRGTHGR